MAADFRTPRLSSLLAVSVNYPCNEVKYAEPVARLGEKIAALREAHQLSLADLGAICRVTGQAVEQWEKGTTKNLRLEPFLRLCAYFRLDPYEFVFGDSPDRPPSSPVDSTGRFRVRKKPT